MQEEIRKLHAKRSALAKTAARKAIEDERKRLAQATGKAFAEITARIEKLQKESNTLRDDALRSARLLGPNPYPGSDAARLKDFQQKLKHHTTADWDYRVPEEVSGKAPPKMKKWLERVRGY